MPLPLPSCTAEQGWTSAEMDLGQARGPSVLWMLLRHVSGLTAPRRTGSELFCISFLLLGTARMQPGSLGQLEGVRMSILHPAPNRNACISASEQLCSLLRLYALVFFAMKQSCSGALAVFPVTPISLWQP